MNNNDPAIQANSILPAELLEIITQLYEATTLTEIADLVIDYLMELTAMACVTIYYAAPEEYRPLRLIGQKIQPGSPIPHAETMFSDDTVAGQSIAERRVIITQDAEASAEYGARMLRRNTRSGISIPLVAQGESVGVLQLADQRAYQFEVSYLPHIERLAHHLALSMNNVVLRQREQRSRQRIETLQQIALVALSTNDTTDAIDVTLQLLATTLTFDQVCITLQSDLLHQIRIAADTRLFASFAQIPIAAEVAEAWSAIYLPDARRDPRWVTSRAEWPLVRSYVGAPLLRSNRVLGVLSLMSQTPFAFQDGDVTLIQTVANHLADMLEKSHIFQRMERRERVAADLVMMGVALSASLDEEEILSVVCEEGGAIFHVDAPSVWLLQNGMLRCVAARGSGADELKDMEHAIHSAEFASMVLTSRRPIYFNHTFRILPLDGLWHRIVGAQALLGVPFMHGNTPLGVLVLADTRAPDRFSPDDLEQLHLFGGQAALAIVNARLFAEARRRVDQLRLVNEMGRVATSDYLLENVIEGVGAALFKEFRYHAITLLLVNDEQKLELYAYLSHDGTIRRPRNFALTDTRSAAWRAWKHGEISMNTGQLTMSAIFGGDDHIVDGCYEVALPLIIADSVIGVLNFERHTPISTDELDVLESVASQMASSVSNTHFFEANQLQLQLLDTRVQAQTQAIREQKEHIEAILQSVADAVIITDLEGNIISQNPAAERFFVAVARITKGFEILQRTLTNLVGNVLESENNEHTATLELGKITLQAKAARVREGVHDVGTVIVLRDITPLREIDRLKSQFVSTVSHELRTPLSNIKLYLKLLETGKPEKRNSYQEVLQSETTRLEHLIARLLDLTRLDQGIPRRMKWFSLLDLIHETVQINSVQARERTLALTFTPPDNLPPMIYGDRDQIAQVLFNLIGNALNYTPSGGRVAVRCIEGAGQLRVEVQDNGIGVEKADLERIFDRFYRGSNVADNVMPGTGLGLAICKEIIALHHGRIGVESVPEQGSTFWFTLPFTKQGEDHVE
jgi:signal transduction histidine kinase/putative methionine-R-sulfoxide reductase with GAF domain